jgi:nucleoside-diphosphate-sugar epimerase
MSRASSIPSEAQRLLNWRPTVSLRTGLKPTIAYFEKLLTDEVVERALLIGS